MELNICLKKINDINLIEINKKNKKNKKIEIQPEEKITHNLKEYLILRRNTEFKNNLRLKSKRLANKEKKFIGTDKDFFEKLKKKEIEIFQKRWTSLGKNIQINRINKYFKDNNIQNKKYLFDLKVLLENKKLKSFVIYNEIEGFIENISDIYDKKLVKS
jgi:hypothetical protein